MRGEGQSICGVVRRRMQEALYVLTAGEIEEKQSRLNDVDGIVSK